MGTPKTLQGEEFHDATSTKPRASHSIPSGGTFSIYGSTKIDAPPQAVYDAILDCASWKHWNTFVPEVRITKHPKSHEKELKITEGTCMVFYVKMTNDFQTTTKTACTHVERLKSRANRTTPPVTRIRWNFDNANAYVPGFILKSERTHEIEETADGKTLYRTWETFGGLVAGHVKSKYGQTLQDRFQDWCKDLAKYVERQEIGQPHMPAELE
ncbi:Hypothetical protein R9X50_00679700 [Acrodontium crateriforme]|uniref:Polyketide cyclase/dehydrase n=1 Tax=Acrodontium crateriforme TaxID=150365 RepID=A0AAQ3RA82_9PEZI|nr:Hypothetical protein R9X50_00679700 [Acrodontium crateriforme]